MTDRTASLETYAGVLEDSLAAANLTIARLEAVLRDRDTANSTPTNPAESDTL